MRIKSAAIFNWEHGCNVAANSHLYVRSNWGVPPRTVARAKVNGWLIGWDSIFESRIDAMYQCDKLSIVESLLYIYLGG